MIENIGTFYMFILILFKLISFIKYIIFILNIIIIKITSNYEIWIHSTCGAGVIYR